MRDKAEKFRELAEARVNNAIEKIRLIRKLANRSNYSYTPEQIRKIKRALEKEVEDTMAAFDTDTPKREFKLD
jgi:rubrerythrin